MGEIANKIRAKLSRHSSSAPPRNVATKRESSWFAPSLSSQKSSGKAPPSVSEDDAGSLTLESESEERRPTSKPVAAASKIPAVVEEENVTLESGPGSQNQEHIDPLQDTKPESSADASADAEPNALTPSSNQASVVEQESQTDRRGEMEPATQAPRNANADATLPDQGASTSAALTKDPITAASPQATILPEKPPRPRTQSILPAGLQTQLLHTLLGGATAAEASGTNEVLLHIPTTNIEDQVGSILDEAAASTHRAAAHRTMVKNRKVWVRRPGGSATLVSFTEDDVVDDVRDTVLRKYSNSLGRQYDAPDLTLRIVPREPHRERTLAPDEPIARLVDAYYPGGQRVDEALVIDAPLRRTPRHSPRAGPPHAPHVASAYFTAPTEEAVATTTAVSGGRHQPAESGTDYFGPAAAAAIIAASGGTAHLANGTPALPHSINVLTTGQLPSIPQIPSPGGARTRNYRDRPERPRLGRQHTSSPTVLNLVTPHAGAHAGGPHTVATAHVLTDQTVPLTAPANSIPTPPAVVPVIGDGGATIKRVGTPPPSAVPARVSSPRPAGSSRPKKSKKASAESKTVAAAAAAAAAQQQQQQPPAYIPPGILSGGVPCINVLIVEDNPINLRLLEVFVKRLKVRFQTAVNGREALDRWRQGGFHLVLMDIQLPVMSGLDATREIRRLERINSIGVFSSSASSAPEEVPAEPADDDKLANRDMFKSPVIIVALTASSLQSDRRDALAAGCNDFLTKPVNFVWFEKKIREWGCMQALIDFDGWQHWNELVAEGADAAAKKLAAKVKAKRNRSSTSGGMTSGA